MHKRRLEVQEDLFRSSGDDLRREVRELDARIAAALKKKEFALARDLSARQAKMIRRLVEAGEGGKGRRAKRRPE